MPKKNKKTIKKAGPHASELSAAGKKKEKDGKKNELTQLQVGFCLSTYEIEFFTVPHMICMCES